MKLRFTPVMRKYWFRSGDGQWQCRDWVKFNEEFDRVIRQAWEEIGDDLRMKIKITNHGFEMLSVGRFAR